MCWNALPDNAVNSSSIYIAYLCLKNVNLNEYLATGRTLVDF